MSEKDDVLILAIESSCDETAAAVVVQRRLRQQPTVMNRAGAARISVRKRSGFCRV